MMSKIVKKVRCHTVIPVESCDFTWSIENFSLFYLKEGEYLVSSMFTTGESLLTTWCLNLHPNENENVAISLERLSSDSSPHYVNTDISLIDANQRKCFLIQLENCLYDASSTYSGRHSIIQRKKLFGEDKVSLLPNDTLTIKCELKVLRVDDDFVHSDLAEQSEEINSADCIDFEKPETLMVDLQQLYENQMCTDLTLKVGDEELKVHKLILCARSSVFNTMLNCDMKENLTNCVSITDFDPPVIKTMLRYIYCGKVKDLTPDLSIQLYSAAEKYNLQALKDICIEYLSRNLNTDNICDVLTLGELHDEPLLKTATKNFICMNLTAIQETEKWLSLSETMPHLVLAMNRLALSRKKNAPDFKSI